MTTPRARATRRGRPSTRSPTAACSAKDSARAAPSGVISRTRTNDFIFAIIGEELGFIGAGAVIGLFALFVYTGLRIARRSADPFLQLLTATATAWITGQAFINIGYVVGVLPVTGLQLPLVSAGGTSTATTLLMFGLVANAARHEPEAVSALHSGQDGRVARLLRLPKRRRTSRLGSGAPRCPRQENRKIQPARGERAPLGPSGSAPAIRTDNHRAVDTTRPAERRRPGADGRTTTRGEAP